MSTTKFQITDPAAVAARVSELKNRSDDIKARVGATLKKLWNPERDLHQITDFSVFQTLKSRFPNFSEVIDLWEGSAIGLTKTGHPFSSPPILLVGNPGLGKTFFAGEAAKFMGLPYYDLSMATASAGFVIAGGNLQWSEGEVGFIAKSLAASEVANPILLLDEIDKSNTGRHYDPLGPFYPLLEPHSAKLFKDEALGFAMDCSKVIWMATANDLDSIPRPIQDRMKICEIKAPSRDQMHDVIKSVYAGIRINLPYGSLLDEEIHEEVTDNLVALSPRKVRQALEEATLRVIRAGRSGLLTVDLNVVQDKGARYGFL